MPGFLKSQPFIHYVHIGSCECGVQDSSSARFRRIWTSSIKNLHDESSGRDIDAQKLASRPGNSGGLDNPEPPCMEIDMTIPELECN